MIKTLIVEDEPQNAQLLKRILEEKYKQLDIVGICSSNKEAILYLKKNKVHLLFLDIILSDGNSFDILEQVAIHEEQIIFISAYDTYAIKAVKFSALDYILKPIDIDELSIAVEKALQKIESNIPYHHQLNVFNLNKERITKIVLPSIDGHTFVNLVDIYYLQGEGNYTSFYCIEEQKIVVSKPLREYETLLESEGFFRVHQSFIINLLHLKKYKKGSGGTVIMENKKEIDVAVRRKDEFLKKIHVH